MKNKVMPSRQGDLDSLCGFYSIANMMYWLYGNKIRRKTLFKSLLQRYSQHWPLIECITLGLRFSQMDMLLQYLQHSRYRKFPITITQPFRGESSQSKVRILQEIHSYLNNRDDRAIILCDQFHWSVVIHADSQHLYFFDSQNYKKKARSGYSIRTKEGKLQLFPEAIYFIERGDVNS